MKAVEVIVVATMFSVDVKLVVLTPTLLLEHLPVRLIQRVVTKSMVLLD